MSVEGFQLPRQSIVQRQTQPVEKNQGSAAIYKGLNHHRSMQSLNINQGPALAHMKDQLNFYRKGSFVGKEAHKKVMCDNFDVTLRNTYNPYFSQGPGYQRFNNQRLSKIKSQSRFLNQSEANDAGSDLRTSQSFIDSSKKAAKSYREMPSKLYDIKGNTFKNTLIPTTTARNSLNFKDEESGEGL